jgi:hypothetical protein
MCQRKKMTGSSSGGLQHNLLVQKVVHGYPPEQMRIVQEGFDKKRPPPSGLATIFALAVAKNLERHRTLVSFVGTF